MYSYCAQTTCTFCNLETTTLPNPHLHWCIAGKCARWCCNPSTKTSPNVQAKSWSFSDSHWTIAFTREALGDVKLDIVALHRILWLEILKTRTILFKEISAVIFSSHSRNVVTEFLFTCYQMSMFNSQTSTLDYEAPIQGNIGNFFLPPRKRVKFYKRE